MEPVRPKVKEPLIPSRATIVTSPISPSSLVPQPSLSPLIDVDGGLHSSSLESKGGGGVPAAGNAAVSLRNSISSSNKLFLSPTGSSIPSAPLATIPSDSEPSSSESSASSVSEHSGSDPCEETDVDDHGTAACAIVDDAAPKDEADLKVKEEIAPFLAKENLEDMNKEYRPVRSRASSTAKSTDGGVRRLSAAGIQQLSDPDALPIGPAPERSFRSPTDGAFDQPRFLYDAGDSSGGMEAISQSIMDRLDPRRGQEGEGIWQHISGTSGRTRTFSSPSGSQTPTEDHAPSPRRNSYHPSMRSSSSNVSLALSPEDANAISSTIRSSSSASASASANTTVSPTKGSIVTAMPMAKSIPPPILASSSAHSLPQRYPISDSFPSPPPTSIPLPPFSLPTHLQLELAGQHPSPLYIRRSASADVPYESSAIKFARLQSMLLLPPYLERTLTFGAFACLDAWLYTFTILPMRFILATGILFKWWGQAIGREAMWLTGFVWMGLGRVRGRIRGRTETQFGAGELAHGGGAAGSGFKNVVDKPRIGSAAGDSGKGVRDSSLATDDETAASIRSPLKVTIAEPRPSHLSAPPTPRLFRHRRTPSQPSELSSFHKADILQGLVIICSTIALMHLDASRMYHFIRAQSAIKLYVIYNVLEVGDRLLGAVGQDIFECLFSAETLSRNASGRSKIILPAGMFLLALAYNILHSTALYYQVITLNVAVNSYSNALLTLLLSNQFVEVKGTVFKRIEKDNLFQLTCADIVERFQLWIMLLIIGMRNVVEVGGLAVPGAGMGGGDGDMGAGAGADAASGPLPLHSPSILPHSFTVLPTWLYGGEVLSPFLIVLASEVLVDTIKHAYVMKFNNIKPKFYSRILDIICKDYYTNAFVTPSLNRRLGLPVIPLSCLFIRSSVQAYNMFLSTRLPTPIPPSTQTALAAESATPSSPVVVAALDRFDALIRDALGRSVHSHPYASSSLGRAPRAWWAWTSDDVIATVMMVVVFFMAFLVLLMLKLLLGMALLRYARSRYAEMKVKENAMRTGGKGTAKETFDAGSKRLGGWGMVEVGDDKKRWVCADEGEGLKKRNHNNGGRGGQADEDWMYNGQGVERYEMVAKRIW